MKKISFKILILLFCLVLIASLAVPVFADDTKAIDDRELPLDRDELITERNDVSRSMSVGNSFYYSYLDSYVLDRGDPAGTLYSYNTGDFWDILLSDGAFLHLTLEPTRFYTGDISTDSIVYTALADSVYYRDSTYIFNDYCSYHVDITGRNVFFVLAPDGVYFYESFHNIKQNVCPQVSFRYGCYDSGNFVCDYFGCTPEDFVTILTPDTFDDYVSGQFLISNTGLFGWIETHFLPLFGVIPTDSIDMGIFGNWSPLQLVRAALWVSLGGVCISAFVVLPYVLILRLTGIKKRRKGSGSR